jgi:hypothetical protein
MSSEEDPALLALQKAQDDAAQAVREAKAAGKSDVQDLVKALLAAKVEVVSKRKELGLPPPQAPGQQQQKKGGNQPKPKQQQQGDAAQPRFRLSVWSKTSRFPLLAS